MKKHMKLFVLLLLVSFGVASLVGCTKEQTSDADQTSETEQSTEAINTDEVLDPGIYVNGNSITFTDEETIDLDLLSVENGISIQVVTESDETVYINGEEVSDLIYLDVSAITREDVLDIEIVSDEETLSYTVNLMPSTFPDYTTEGESTTDGDFYLSTYDLSTNYIFKLNNQGDLIFYKAITKIDSDGNEVNTNGLDFRKQYTSNGEVRYTYMPYLEDAFADGDCSGINPGCVVVMDENYDVIDEIYYLDENGDEIMIDPHGFIWIDEGHYIVTAYKQQVVDVPEDLGAVDNCADLAVLYIQEVKDGEILWEFSTEDYTQFLYESSAVTWSASTDRCYDYVHFNSMSIDEDDNLLVSCRHLDAILKISRDDGSLMWQLGGDYDDFSLTDEQLFSYQHSIIVTDSGSYMIFDNANTAVGAGNAEYSSVIRLSVDEDTMTVTDFVRYQVVDYFSNYMGAIREIDSENSVYLWSIGGNYSIDSTTPPEWSMVEYTETDGDVSYNFCFRFDNGTRRLYCSNKCE